MFFRRKTGPTDQAPAIQALRNFIEQQEQRLTQLEADHAKLQLAFNSFRQRVYAWRKWEPEQERQRAAPPEAPESPPSAEKPPLDKAAILRAHRSKQ